MNRCIAHTAQKTRCLHNAVQDGQRCRIHTQSYNRHVVRFGEPTGCQHIVSSRHWCNGPRVNGELLCQHHATAYAQAIARIEQARAVEHAFRQARNLWVEQQLAEQPQPSWRTVVDRLFANPHVFPDNRDRFDVALHYFFRVRGPAETAVDLHEYHTWVRNGRPPQVAQNPLARLAGDAQNVHTTVVSKQTNEYLGKLVELGKQDGFTSVPNWVAARWLTTSFGHWPAVVRIVEDMRGWYGRASCRADGDRLYHYVLNGVYRKIRMMEGEEPKRELWKRLFEECNESVGMCCEGHLSRLCNVFVGFDDAFAPPVPVGELLQQKMGAIAMMDVSTEEKLTTARAVLAELKVPETDHAVWLEAFE